MLLNKSLTAGTEQLSQGSTRKPELTLKMDLNYRWNNFWLHRFKNRLYFAGKTILLIGNALIHSDTETLQDGHIRAMFLVRNVTAICQPID